MRHAEQHTCAEVSQKPVEGLPALSPQLENNANCFKNEDNLTSIGNSSLI